MMIDLTVKTLDSQNHAFSLNDDITVRQFKEHIAETVNIAADLQRLIYCGRVLQDEKQLSEYDVNGKVIHLVQRAPPSSTHRNSSSSQSQSQSQSGEWPPSPRIHYRQTQFHGNPMYVGSVSIPSDVLEGYDFPVPQLSSSIINSHLNVIRRMLDQANRVIDRLENPTGPTSTSSSTENTSSPAPVVPSCPTEAEDSASQFSTPSGSSAPTPVSSSQVANDTPPEPMANVSTSPSSSAPEEPSPAPTNDALVPREFSELLSSLLATQDRLRPFIRDRILTTEPREATAEDNQRIIDGVTECFHFLSHAQHALSNLSINMQQPAPRTLRCRPMILQPSAILQAGVPIQVEAHISLHGQADGNSEGEETSNSANLNPTGPSQTTGASATSATASTELGGISTTTESRPTSAGQTNPAESGFPPVFNFPNNVEVVMEMGPQAPRVWSFSTNDQNSGSNNNNNTSTANNNNSGGTAGSNGGGSFPWGAAPSPDIIRNLMQAVAGYMAQTGGPSPPTPATTTSTNSNSSSSSSTSSSTTPIGYLRRRAIAVAVGDSGGSTGQNSQTRGNTETHPTTSTQTRTTSRTHVIHQHAQALGVGMGLAHSFDFDPFLTCNSHHIRRQAQATTNTAASTQTGQGRENSATSTQSQSSSTGNGRPRVATITGVQIVDNLFNNASLAESIHNADRNRTDRSIPFNTLLLNRGINFMTDEEMDLAPYRLLRLVYTVLGRVPIYQWFRWLNGEIPPLNDSIIGHLRRKLHERYGIKLTMVSTPYAIAKDVCRELRPYLERTFDGENATDRAGRAIDICATVEGIINLHIDRAAQVIISDPVVENLVSAVRDLARDLNAVLRFSLRGGESGLERVIERFATEMTRGTHELFREWIHGPVVDWFCTYSRRVARLSDTEVISLLTYKDDLTQVATTSSETPRNQPQPAAEPMDVDSASNDRANSDLLLDDGEDVPTTFPDHENLLPDWVPIIARDGSRQRRQLQLGLSDGNVTTLSDAYLATMPSKRRKLVEQQKPSLLVSPTPNHSAIPSSMERLVRESVGRAGFEEVDGAVAALVADPTVRRAFGQAIRESLNPRRYQTPDFPDPLRFPNATKFFNDSNRPPKQ